MPDTTEILENAAAEFKAKKKLSSETARQVKRALEEIIRDPESSQGPAFMLKLPIKLSTDAFLAAWRGSDKTTQISMVESLMTEQAYRTPPGYQRKIDIIGEVISNKREDSEWNELALPLMLNLSSDLTKSGGKKPAQTFLDLLRNKVLMTGQIWGMTVTGTAAQKEDLVFLEALVLLSIFPSESVWQEDDFDRCRKALHWLEAFPSGSRVDPKTQKLLEGELKSWPKELQRECVNLGIIQMITYRDERVQGVSKREIHPTAEKASGATARTEKLSEVDRHLSAVGEHIRSLELQLNSSRSRSVSLEGEISSLQSQISLLKSELGKTTATLEEEQLRVTELEDVTKKLSRDIERQTAKEAQQAKDHKQEIAKLHGQMDVENKYVLEEFQNKVAQQLQFQFQEYVEMREAAATVKLAEHLRHLVGEVFKALGKNGINFD